MNVEVIKNIYHLKMIFYQLKLFLRIQFINKLLQN